MIQQTTVPTVKNSRKLQHYYNTKIVINATLDYCKPPPTSPTKNANDTDQPVKIHHHPVYFFFYQPPFT